MIRVVWSWCHQDDLGGILPEQHETVIILHRDDAIHPGGGSLYAMRIVLARGVLSRNFAGLRKKVLSFVPRLSGTNMDKLWDFCTHV